MEVAIIDQLYCLHLCSNAMFLELAKVEELELLEINLLDKLWRFDAGNWREVGKEESEGFIKFVFQPKDFEQLKKAFLISSHFCSINSD